MNLVSLNYMLGGLLLLIVVTGIAMRTDPTRPNVEFVPMMRRSSAFDAYSANPRFPNGRTMQTPVPGTISRGELPLYYEATKEDAERAGRELQNPFAIADSTIAPENDDAAKQNAEAEASMNASIQRGAGLYNVYCNSCHGPGGAGDGPVAKRGFPPPPSLTAGKSVQMMDGQLFHILTYGQGSMSPMAAQLSRHRRWDVINFVRSMQQGAKQEQAQQGEAGPPQAGQPQDGPPQDAPPSPPTREEEGR